MTRGPLLIRANERLVQVCQYHFTGVGTFGDTAVTSIVTLACYFYSGSSHRRREPPTVHEELSLNVLLPSTVTTTRMRDKILTIVDSDGNSVHPGGTINAILTYPHLGGKILYRQVTIQVL